MKKYYPIIGLEVHIELNTKSKMFCQCNADYFDKKPNSEVCPVCLGLPGALPVPNKRAIEYTQIVAKSLGCKLNKKSRFDRKHYFYPDLPKGYQISQYEEPFGQEGQVILNNKKITIRRVHLEEDTGKLIHKSNASYIDFNRSGVPLVEIVTNPDFDNSDDVKVYLEYLHVLVQQYLKVSNANMEQGSMRLEPNISLSTVKGKLPNYKIEVKNINSFKYVKRAIDYEIQRQESLLNAGKIIKNETRGFNENKNITFSQRTKESAKDYRYFPEPDIPPFEFTDLELASFKLPELPNEKVKRYIDTEKLNITQAFTLSKNLKKAELFDKLTAHFKDKNKNFKIANLIINKLLPSDVNVITVIKKIENALNPETLISDDIYIHIKDVISANPKATEDFKSGKENALFFLIGKLLKIVGNNLDVEQLKNLLIKELKK